MIVNYKGKRPRLDGSAFAADNATLIGDVTVGEDSSIWFGAVLRGDNEPIMIGRRTSIQDNATLHSDPGHALTVGDDVTVGHNAVVHGCTVRDGALIGMGAVVLDDAVVGEFSVVGAGAVVTAGTVIPPYSLALGVPAKVVRTDRTEQKQSNLANAAGYVARKNAYKAGQSEKE